MRIERNIERFSRIKPLTEPVYSQTHYWLFWASAVIGIVAGTLLPNALNYLSLLFSHAMWLLCLALLLGFLYFLSQYRTRSIKRTIVCVSLFFLSLNYGAYWLDSQIVHRLPLSHDRTSVFMDVTVLSLERTSENNTRPSYRLQADVKSCLEPVAVCRTLPPLRKVRVNLYPRTNQLDDLDHMPLGQRWRISAVLRAPKNLVNGLVFDYEASLLAKGIDATGYVRQWQVLNSDDGLSWSERFHRLRHRYLHYVSGSLTDDAYGWVRALVFGEKTALTPSIWTLAQQTGTVHLWVVSGLHLGIVAMLVWFLWRILSRITAFALGRSLIQHSWLFWLFLWGATAFYAALSGWGVSVQRAWWMLFGASVIHLSLGGVSLKWIWALALLVVLCLNPLAYLQMGFLLSFTAVMALFSTVNTRLRSRHRLIHWAMSFSRAQWAVFWTMLPLLSYLLLPVSLSSLLANAFAIPWLSFVSLPLALITAVWPNAISAVALSWTMDTLVSCLTVFAEHAFTLSPMSMLQTLSVSLVVLCYVWMGPSRSRFFGALAVVLALVLHPAKSVTQARVLDVGQGLSVVFATKEGASILYDTGWGLPSGRGMGAMVVAPTLRDMSINHLSWQVISHSDLDHAGGVAGVLASGVSADTLWLGQPLDAIPNGQNCHEVDDRWHALSHQLSARFLSTSTTQQGTSKSSFATWRTDNNQSCVLQVRFLHATWLLPGDIDRQVEAVLVKKYGKSLNSDVLVLAHHGSKTSTTDLFLNAVKPKYAIASAGFNHRYGHPHESVVKRLRRAGVTVFNTAVDGQVRMNAHGQLECINHRYQAPWRQR